MSRWDVFIQKIAAEFPPGEDPWPYPQELLDTITARDRVVKAAQAYVDAFDFASSATLAVLRKAVRALNALQALEALEAGKPKEGGDGE